MSLDSPDSAPAPAFPNPRYTPWPGFALAADAAVRHLNDRFGLDLWLVTHVEQDRQVVVASSGHWVDLAAPGTAFSWPESFCLRMVTQRGPTVAPDVLLVPEYAAVATGVLARVRAYVGVPLEADDGQLFGTLCAFAGEPQRESLGGAIELVQLVGQLLSTILAREQLARERSEAAAAAYALAERDRLTALRNRRGWESVLAQEERRCRRYGSTASVLVLDLDDIQRTGDEGGHAAGDERLLRCADVLLRAGRPEDAAARLGGDEFGVLAVQCDTVSARALLARLRVELRSAGLPASVGAATRRMGETLPETWRRADQAMDREKRRRRVRPPASR